MSDLRQFEWAAGYRHLDDELIAVGLRLEVCLFADRWTAFAFDPNEKDPEMMRRFLAADSEMEECLKLASVVFESGVLEATWPGGLS